MSSFTILNCALSVFTSRSQSARAYNSTLRIPVIPVIQGLMGIVEDLTGVRQSPGSCE